MAQVEMPKQNNGQKQPEVKHKFDKAVVKGKVNLNEPNDIQKLARDFLAEDLHTVKQKLLGEYLLPMLKNGMASLLTSAINLAFFGEDRPHANSQGYSGSRVQRNSYDGYYQNNHSQQQAQPVRRSLHNIDFEFRGEADDTLAQLRMAIQNYGSVSLGDLWDLMGVSSDNTDFNYGWYDLGNAYIKGVPGGFRLVLPTAVPLH